MKICKICGIEKDKHHKPEWITIPDGCVCDWQQWDVDSKNTLPKICDKYDGDGTIPCLTCEHDEACHEKAK